MQISKKKGLQRLMPIFLYILSVAAILNVLMPAVAFAAPLNTLEITGKGVTNPATFTPEQLEGMEQHQEVYSSINTWPTKRWYVGKGVKLWDLLLEAGIKEDEAKLVTFVSADGYTLTLTMEELFHDKRYRFPYFKNGRDSDGHLPGSPEGAVEVEPIIALISVEGSDNPKYMNDTDAFLLMLGQRAVTEQTGNLFVKYLSKIEISTAEPEQWDAPQANPAGGAVPEGAMVTLSNLHSDDDKIHYTTDGSDPTLNSPMYNLIASRWWSTRFNVLGTINSPIGPINENTTIKAVTIGPGKRNSEVVTFNYYVGGIGSGDEVGISDGDQEPVKHSKVIKLTIGRPETSVNGKSYILDAVPYIDIDAGRTLVPVRFISEAMGAEVNWDPKTRQAIITDENKQIVLTIDSRDVLINGEKQTIDCAATIHSNRTYVPLRFVSEALEAQVEYNEETKGITITK
ncbi:MAG: stalk domain-containing protein [Natronincolaceae bacterium]|jgi:hypothetical protein|nr:stalk domain-containing protein [Bacillota bacterium]NLK91217.1 hypothetical protein [Clostridiales bacterium]